MHCTLPDFFGRRAGFLLLSAFLVLFIVALGLHSPAPAPTRLAVALDEVLSERAFQNCFWGLHVVNLQTGQVLYSNNGDKNMIPASNQKLFTTATALDALGSNFRYQTVLYFNGSTQGDTMLVGDLIVRGSGDPTFGSRLHPGDPVRDWARQLAEMGVRRFRGRIIGDDRTFSGSQYGDGWDISLIGNQTYAAAAGGLSYRDNLAVLSIEGPGGGSDMPVIRSEPEGFISVYNSSATAGRQRFSSLRIDRLVGTNDVSVSGSVPSGYRGRIQVPIHDPRSYALHSLAAAMQSNGIQVEAPLVDARSVAGDINYDRALPIGVHLSPAMSEIIAIINKRSNNFYAEQVFRTFAAGGSTDGGERRVKALLSKTGFNAQSVSVRDGSGLSRKNLVSPRSITELLVYMNRHPEREAFMASLPTGGEAGTTLRYRLGNAGIRAKTGTLEFTRALSGYITAQDGSTLAFSMMTNNFATHPTQISQAQNRIIELLSTTPLN